MYGFGSQYFVEDFCIYVHQGYWPVNFFLVSLSGFSIKVFLDFSISLETVTFL
jgi:hypothetical protein